VIKQTVIDFNILKAKLVVEAIKFFKYNKKNYKGFSDKIK